MVVEKHEIMEGKFLSSRRKERNIIYLAYFFRYGYLASMALILWRLAAIDVPANIQEYVFFSMSVIFGIYSLIGLRFRFKHVYCAMQNAYHQKMTPNNIYSFPLDMVRDLKYSGLFFIIIGVLGILGVYKGI